MAKTNQAKCFPSHRRARHSFTVRSFLTLALLAAGMAGPSIAAAGTVDCETRTELRRVSLNRSSWRHYVVDRVTRCWTPDAAVAPVAPPEPVSVGISAPLVGEPPVAIADARPEWRDRRTRLTNAQYSRSLRAIGEVRKQGNRTRR